MSGPVPVAIGGAAAGLGLLAVGAAGWAVATTSTALTERLEVVVAGSQVAPEVSAAALVVLAASAALPLGGRRIRWVALAGLLLGGLLAAAGALAAGGRSAAAAARAAAELTGVGAVDSVRATPLPALTLAVAGLVVALAVLGAVRARHWSPPTSRDAPTGPNRTSERDW